MSKSDIAPKKLDRASTTPKPIAEAKAIGKLFSSQTANDRRLEELAAMPEPRSKYLIAITPRSGGVYLADALKQAKRFGTPGQMLNNIPSRLKHIPARTPDEYIRNAMRQGKTPNGVSGLIADWRQLERFKRSLPEPGYLDNFKYIYLTRQDKAAQAVSLYIANKTSLWHNQGQKAADKHSELEYCFAEINPCYEKIAAQEEAWESYFLALPIAPLCISYEDLEADLLGTLRRIAAHVGVMPENVALPEGWPAANAIGADYPSEWARRFERDRKPAPPAPPSISAPEASPAPSRLTGLKRRIARAAESSGRWLSARRHGADKPPSRYRAIKEQAIGSFIRFAAGQELPERPLTLMLEVSNLCDLQCAMCTTFSAINPERTQIIKNQQRGFFETQEIAAIKPYLESALQVHAFGYGEPMLHPDFLDILNLLKSYEVMVDFFTNGMHLTEENCRAIVDSRVAAITISFSGISKGDYENVYIKGNFNTVMDGIRRLAAYKRESRSPYPRIEINSLGFQHHVQHLPEFVRMMGNAGVNVIYLKPLHVGAIPFMEPFVSAYRPGIEGKIIDEAMAIAKQMKVHLNVEVFKRDTLPDEANLSHFAKSKRQPWGDRIQKRFPYLNLASTDDIQGLAKKLKQAGVFRKPFIPAKETRAQPRLMQLNPVQLARPCFEPFKSFYIHVNGNIRPCCFSDAALATLGNVFDDGINVWRNEPFTQLQNGVLRSQYPAMCDHCIRVNDAPSKHDINAVATQYAKWHRHVFAGKLSKRLINQARKLPDNQKIIEAWKSQT